TFFRQGRERKKIAKHLIKEQSDPFD
ncbi:TPA: tRNA-specific adenosine deaminase, partial [Streptococcus pyogenes]|nr:tRNA-specific adenosine deaminase [Streptococcus pyogenes]